MKKIIYIITKSNWGGASRYVFDLATNLPKDEYLKAAICGGQGRLSEKLLAQGVKTYCINEMKRDMNMQEDGRSFFKIWNILKNERPDIIHLNSPKAAGLGALAGRLLGIKKIVFTVHGFTFNEDRSFFHKTLIKFFSWITILLSHNTILLSNIEYDQVKKWPFIEKKISVIPLGIDLPFFYTRQEARKKLSELSGIHLKENLVVGTIAELHKNKGYLYAIEALTQFPHIYYLVIGDGEEMEKLKNKVKEYGASNILFLGAVEDAATLLTGFDIFLLPSIKEGLPYTILEAGYLEVPVVATNVGGIPTLIEHGISGTLLRPKHSEDIVWYIEEYLKNPLNIKGYSSHLFASIKKNHTLPQLIESTTMLYKKQ